MKKEEIIRLLDLHLSGIKYKEGNCLGGETHNIVTALLEIASALNKIADNLKSKKS